MTAWEVGTGQRPFEGLTMGQLIKKVFVKEERPSTADFEDGLKQLVESCWAPEPDDRPTFEEIKEVRPARERSERTERTERTERNESAQDEVPRVGGSRRCASAAGLAYSC
jgi:hypothetical protein